MISKKIHNFTTTHSGYIILLAVVHFPNRFIISQFHRHNQESWFFFSAQHCVAREKTRRCKRAARSLILICFQPLSLHVVSVFIENKTVAIRLMKVIHSALHPFHSQSSHSRCRSRSSASSYKITKLKKIKAFCGTHEKSAAPAWKTKTIYLRVCKKYRGHCQNVDGIEADWEKENAARCWPPATKMLSVA